MAIFGTVRKGRIVLDDWKALSQGQRVRIEPVSDKDAPPEPGKSQVSPEPNAAPATQSTEVVHPGKISDWLKELAEFVGSVDGPSDLASNHGHYAHQQPKEQQ